VSRTIRYILILTLVAGSGLVLSPTADAQSARWHRPPPAPRPFSFQLEDESGNVLRTFQHEGRTFVLGEPGERYSVRVFNPTAQRVEAVISVDGRDAISGDIGDFTRQRGYILEPFGSVAVDGFRRSLDEVAAFRFTSPGNSYSARRGTPQNVGVIGVAFFPERQRPPVAIRRPRTWERSAPRSKRAEAPERAESARKGRSNDRSAAEARGGSTDNLGTEYGESRTSSVVEIPFTRASSRPAQVVSLRYDDAEGLMARGIDLGFHQRRSVGHNPLPFPNSGRFAPPPPR
jgi:hypothetical protein